ncbi:MAG TPA: immunoglobulin domain-containing protein [Candidatus Limnocylindria bacterium]|nr:immunoglobulin domain-containing protein [Candidatus Limnocylindria bacterium]
MRVSNFPRLFRSLLIALAGLAMNLARADESTPPTVTITPAAATVAAGTNFTFTANVTGGTATSYQWQESVGGTYLDIDGATNSTLVFTNVQTSDYGSYTVVVGSAAGVAVSPAATLNVDGLPLIVTLPPNVSQYLGEDAVFSATIYSTTPVTNGWFYNSILLTNAITNVFFADTVTNGYLTTYAIKLTNLLSTNAGVYSLFVTNAAGVTALSAGLTVLDLPDPALRFGPEVIVGGQIQFPVFYTAHGGDTNLSFSVAYDPAVFSNAAFTPNTTESMGVIVVMNYFPPWVSMPALNLTNSAGTGPTRKGPKPAALPDRTNVVVQTTGTPGALGVSLTLQNGFVLPPGEDPDTLGTVTFDLVPGAPNPYAGRVTFTNAPVPLAFSPVAISTNSTNTTVTTNGVITFTQTPPTLVSSNFVSTATGPKLNLQTGNFEQVVQFANPGASNIDNVFLVIGLLGTDSNTNAIRHQNAQGYLTTGESFVSMPGLAPGNTDLAILEYFAPDHMTVRAPTLTAYSTTIITNTLANTTPIGITTNRFVDNGILRGFLVEFPTQASFHYYVQYADHAEDFVTTNRVRTALPAVLGTGNRVQWLDNGPPKTDSLPTNGARFYQVLETR